MDVMMRKVLCVLILFLVASVVSVFALTLHELYTSLQNGESGSTAAVNASKSWSNADQAQAGWDRYSSQINRAESAIQDAENYASVNGSLPDREQKMVNQIKANLRQVRDKMSSFGISTSWAISL
jgi:Skp family chaperone for outer membrane proteins